MEMETTNRRLLLYVLLPLCIANLAGTLYLTVKIHSAGSHPPEPATPPLPLGLDSREARMILFDKFRALYNAKDSDRLYSLFDEASHLEQSKDALFNVLHSLYGVFGQIKSGAYERHQVHTGPNGVKKYTLYYRIDTEKRPALLLIVVLQQDTEPYRVTGFRILNH